MFTNTTTIGIRRYKLERTVLNRDIIKVSTKYGTADVKKCIYGTDVKFYPEYKSVSEICDKFNVSYQDAYAEIVNACKNVE